LYRWPPAGAFDFALGFGDREPKKIQKRRPEASGTKTGAGVSRLPFSYNPVVPRIRSRGKLPHWEADNAIYFVTFRLADSLPQNVLRGFEFERRDIIAIADKMDRSVSQTEQKRLEDLLSERIQDKLDAGTGSCSLARPAIADIVSTTLQRFAQTRYRMYAWCVMPNHVHALFRILANYSLADVVRSWKSYSARKANLLLGRTGQFWQREYYDHLVRSEEEFHRIVGYIAENPAKAGLKNWKWVGVDLRL
jgi:REP element-mobilizing transposase RayT